MLCYVSTAILGSYFVSSVVGQCPASFCGDFESMSDSGADSSGISSSLHDGGDDGCFFSGFRF